MNALCKAISKIINFAQILHFLFGVATHNFFAPLGFDDIVLDDI
jgi:hypothetical protein